MKGYTDFPITIGLPFEHCCKDCNNFCLERRTNFRDATLREMLKDIWHGREVHREIPTKIIKNWCDDRKCQMDPEAKEPCFIWTGSHEAWMPEITATIVDGKVKVVFE